MRILLINVPIWKYLGFKASYNPGLGILYIGAVLRERGHEVRVVDAEAYGWWFDDIMKAIDDWKPTHVGLSSLSNGLLSAIEITRLIKSKHPDIWVALGGAGPTVAPQYALEKSGCDSVTIGESEPVLDQSFSVRGIIEGRPVENLDTLPLPAWDLLEPAVGSEYWSGNLPRPPVEKFKEAVVMWSRGCPHACTFCSKPVIGKGAPRRRSREGIVKELNWLRDSFDINSIFVYDDELIGMSEEHNRWLFGVIHEILEVGPVEMKYKGQGRCSEKFVEDDEQGLLFHMKLAGFFAMMMGCESGSDYIKRRMRKGTTNDDIRHTLKTLIKHGIETYAYWMVGFPEETPQIAGETERLIAELCPYITWIQISILSPLPGSAFWNEAIENGWFLGDIPDMTARREAAIEHMTKNFQVEAVLNMPWMSRDAIQRWQHKLYMVFNSCKVR